MNILIRCDIGGSHGLGHAVRMLALAQECASRGGGVRFITSTPALQAFVPPFPCQMEDAHIQFNAGDVYIVDTKDAHAQGNDTLLALRQHGLRVVRIDHPHATLASCDLLVAPVAHWAPETVATLRTTFGERFLYGWDYVMLAPEVTALTPLPYAQRKDGPMVFCAGGSNPTGALAKMAQWCGGMGQRCERIFLMPEMLAEYATMPPWVTCVPFERCYLRDAALVIGMFGVTTYECLFYQTPMIVFSHTHENWTGANWLCKATGGVMNGVNMAAPELELLSGNWFCDMIDEVWVDAAKRQKMHHASMGLLDGHGIHRVASAILTLA